MLEAENLFEITTPSWREKMQSGIERTHDPGNRGEILRGERPKMGRSGSAESPYVPSLPPREKEPVKRKDKTELKPSICC